MDDNKGGGGGGGTRNHCNIYGCQKWIPLSATSMAFFGCVLFIGAVITTFWIIPEDYNPISFDLKPWRETGISRQEVDLANRTATFRLVILDGRAYVEAFHRSFQTRDLFTMWGVVQLLRLYPGRVPDLDLMFDCGDMPVVKSMDYRHRSLPPPLFQYCGEESSVALVFPDWSFWGWVEANIKPWEVLIKELKAGNERLRWVDRIPYAYWKGNPYVGATRGDLLRIGEEKLNKDSSTQIWRINVITEGRAWSVSEKYILACDSPSLLVNSRYYDHFTRGLMPGHHYWPIRDDNKCRDIKFAVDWGNTHKKEAQAIGKAGSRFILEELKMDYVYDYMFHFLREYAKLLKYKPTKPPKAKEICVESMACAAKGREREYMLASMVNASYDLGPCDLPPPYDPMVLQSLLQTKTMFTEQIQLFEQKAQEKQNP
ncbi:hypothetical protein QJS10_CPB18g01548 [Acorus calamus]|uniref:Glycosyl transferase CAP10 domain-containing protein n=1 Tax=Acorus calamus TaxID=4465 RepID=A0AAV9CKI7_ACOCL|nr:hypothetical protein QJS10_CPB18g01548 [Acorus calamus]